MAAKGTVMKDQQHLVELDAKLNTHLSQTPSCKPHFLYLSRYKYVGVIYHCKGFLV